MIKPRSNLRRIIKLKIVPYYLKFYPHRKTYYIPFYLYLGSDQANHLIRRQNHANSWAFSGLSLFLFGDKKTVLRICVR